MRHLGSIVLSLLVAPVIYVLTGVGLVKMSQALSDSGSSKYGALTVALAALLAAGLLYAVLTLSRLSPLGPVLAGLALFGVTMWAVLNGDSFTDTMPSSVFGIDSAGHQAAGGAAALLAVPLLATIVIPRRWRRFATSPAAVPAPGYAPGYGDSSAYPGTPGYQNAAPSYGTGYGDGTAAYPGSPSYPGSSAYPGSPAWPSADQQSVPDPETTRRLNQ